MHKLANLAYRIGNVGSCYDKLTFPQAFKIDLCPLITHHLRYLILPYYQFEWRPVCTLVYRFPLASLEYIFFEK
jgi:hypothetical protein